MILDIIFFGFIIVFSILGFLFGFFKTLISFFGWFISLLLSYLLAKAIANAFLSAGTAQWLVGEGSLFDKVYKIIPEGLKNIKMDPIRAAVNNGESIESIREEIKSQSQGLLFFASSLVQSAVTKGMYIDSTIDNVGQVLALELTYHIYVILVGVIFFIVLRIVVMGLSLIFKNKLVGREVKSWERFAGIAMGAVRGFAYACILLMLATYLSGASAVIKKQTEESQIGVAVASKVSESTGKKLSDDLENNKNYSLMIDMLEQRFSGEEQTN